MSRSQRFISTEPGSVVAIDGRAHELREFVAPTRVLVRDMESQESWIVHPERIQSLNADPDGEGMDRRRDLAAYTEHEWQTANERYSAIAHLVGVDERGVADVDAAAKAAGVSRQTIYRWLRDYERADHLSVLVPRRRGPKAGGTRLTPEQETILQDTIDELYLSKQRLRPAKVITEFRRRCYNAGVRPPHDNTVRNRIKTIPRREVLKRRGFHDEARDKYSPIRGKFPGGNFPLDLVQIDHTPADIVVVDEIHRKPIGRPYLTVAIDVYTRIVTGLLVSLSAPSAVSVGLCIANSILLKEDYLRRLGLDGDEAINYPIWGVPRTIHVDNAKEFRGKMLEKACAEYRIDLQFRPAKMPNYGGHIERLIGTLGKHIHTLPGTTFSNTQARKGYDSDREAAMTLHEFERDLVRFIIGVYHKTTHSKIGVPPQRLWEQSILGDESKPGVGMPPLPDDPERIRIDFLPFEMRTVQRYGVQIEGVTYYNEALTPWIAAKDERTGKRRSFIVRYDPRDMSQVYFFDPDTESHITVPYANLNRPPASLEELKEAKQVLRAQGLEQVNEAAVFQVIEQHRAEVEQAIERTRKARRKSQNIKRTKTLAAARGSEPLSGEQHKPETGDRAPTTGADDIFDDPVTPFTDGD